MSTPTKPAPHEAITAALRTADGLSDRQVRMVLVHLFTDLSLHCRYDAQTSKKAIARAVQMAVQHVERVKV